MSNPFATTDQVNAVIKVRRGPEVDREQLIYEDGELIYSTDKKRLFVGDGFEGDGTQGGNIVGNKIWYVDSFDKLPEIEVNDLVYRTDAGNHGFYLFYGNNPLLSSNYVLVGGTKLITDNVNLQSYSLPDATKTDKGGVIVGNGLSASNGLLTINYDSNIFKLDNTNKLTLLNPATTVAPSDATYNIKGLVQISDGATNSIGGLGVSNGVVSVNIDKQTIKLNGSNTLYVDKLSSTNPASTTVRGSIKVGRALSATADGTLSVGIDNNTIMVDGSNNLYVAAGGGTGPGTTTSFTLNNGTTDLVGINKLTIQTGLELTNSGELSLHAASDTDLGGVIIGDGLILDGGGNLTVRTDNDTLSSVGGVIKVNQENIGLSGAINGTTGAGWQKIGSVILIWGEITMGAGATTQTYYGSKTLPNAAISITATHKNTTGTPTAVGATATTSQITVKGPANGEKVSWMVIGV
jgi:hypothetical protein